MIKFNNIIDGSYGDYDSKHKKIKILTKTMGKIHSTYDGVVVSTYNNKCNGYVLIKHMINNDVYYSEYCNIPRTIVTKNDFVRKGQTIGHSLNDTDEIVYELLNNKGNNINPQPFFKGFNILNPTTPSEKSHTKQEVKKSENKKEVKKSENKKKVKKSENKKEVIPNNNNLFLSLALAPLDFVVKQTGKIAKNTKKELKKSSKEMFKLKDDSKSEDENNQLNEQIQKIKKLL